MASTSAKLLQANQVNFADRTISGTVRRLTYRNEQNGYFVAKIVVAGIEQELAVVGYAASIHEGEILEAEGRWEVSRWGRRFKASSVRISAPADEAGLVKYLAGVLKGVGPAYAEKLVKAFGDKVKDVLSESPERLAEVPGIGAKRAKTIAEAWADRGTGDNVLPWLCGLGLSLNYARKIHERFGAHTRSKVTDNPYVLASTIRGIGFLKADAIARKIGLSESNPYRIRAALLHVMQSATDSGSCGLPREHLIHGVTRGRTKVLNGARDLLGFEDADRTALIEQELNHLIEEGTLVAGFVQGTPCVFLRSIYDAERRVANNLVGRLRRPVEVLTNLDEAITAAETELGITLESTQRTAVANAVQENVSILTGGPGTGKTTITRAIVTILEDAGHRVLVCAPTGKAAKRASEAIGVPAATIHRTLEWGSSGPQYNEERQLECDALVLDEMSMVDVDLLDKLLAALPLEAKLIMVGDADQLPSIGPGKVLTDLIASGRVPTTRLTEIFRQAQQSHIIRNAHRVNQGYAPLSGTEDGSDFAFHHFDSAEEAQEALLTAARDIWKLGFDPIRDVQVLAPMRKGPLGVDLLNVKLQAMLNPFPDDRMPFQGGHLGIGDKVIQIRNNYSKEVFNGEVGFVLSVNPVDQAAVIDFDGRAVEYTADDLDELRLAYAFTIHRSQGSEFPVVLMGLHTSHYVMLKRNLLYTGITRARQRMLVFGSMKAAAIAATQCQNEERYSKLRDWLAEAEIDRKVA